MTIFEPPKLLIRRSYFARDLRRIRLLAKSLRR
jgi:hypothetical protein